MISFSCSHCGLKLKVKPEFAGRSSKCPTCKRPLVVPQPDRTEGHIPKGEIDGTPSSIAQAGVEGGVTLGQKSIQELLARNKKGQRYIIQNEIARGGMGVVMLGIDSDLRREVAIKMMLKEGDPKQTIRFMEEAQITGQLEHPNIVPIHELGLDAQKRMFFTMKMVRGRSLKEVVDMLRDDPKVAEKDWSLGRLLNVFVNVCNGLAYAHSRGVVHRDLKPANIMTGDFGEVYVMDWGLAKVLGDRVTAAAPMATLASGVSSSAPSAVSVSSSQSRPSSKVVTSREDEADLTQEGAVVGTPVYMPPEQAMGEIDQIDQRSDVYSLGAILYEMLALVPPIEKDGGYLNILMRVSEGTITPPEVRVGQSSGIVTDTSQSSGTRLLSGLKTKLKHAMAGTASKLRGTTKPTVPWHIPAELSAVAMKALAKEKKDRYQSVEALRQDIERFQEGRSVSAKEDTKNEMIWKFVKRNKGFSAASFTASILIAVILFYSFKYNYQERVKAERANKELVAEKNEKEDRTRKAVPALVGAARMFGESRKPDDALTQLDLALTYDKAYPPARLLKGQVLIAKRDFPNALAELDQYLKAEPKDKEAQELARLCQHVRPEDGERLLALADVLLRQKALGLSDCLMEEVKKLVGSNEKLLPVLQKRIEAAWPGLGNNLTMEQKGGGLRLDFTNCGNQVRDLTPLKGMPITHLGISGCSKVRDFSPLKGMPLTYLHCHSTQIADLSPLQGMPLTYLVCNETQVSDLSPLKGMPLTYLACHSTKVADLTPLKDMPLKGLYCDFKPERDTEILRSIKTLETINGQPAKEVWKNVEAKQKEKKP